MSVTLKKGLYIYSDLSYQLLSSSEWRLYHGVGGINAVDYMEG